MGAVCGNMSTSEVTDIIGILVGYVTGFPTRGTILCNSDVGMISPLPYGVNSCSQTLTAVAVIIATNFFPC